MKLILHETRLLLSGLAFGLVFMPLILWYIAFKYGFHLIVYKDISVISFYREIYTGLDNPLVWLCLLLPYLLLRLVLLQFRSKSPGLQAATPLAHAAAGGREDKVMTLLTEGGDIDAGNKLGQTPLHLAAEQGNNSVVKILLEQGALVDVVDTAAGFTPLHYAADLGHSDVCELLIRFGADPDALTENQDSPLHLATNKGQAGVVSVLLKYHARLDVKNKSGMTPLQLAESLKHQEIVRLINQYLSESWPYLQISRC